MDKKKIIIDSIRSHIDLVESNKKCLVPEIEKCLNVLSSAIKNNKKIIWCGNGGSASQANHLSAELVGGMYKSKKEPFNSICLNTDTAFITAWSNDDDYENIFSRQLDALGMKGDILIALSTSGNSKNIINAVKLASEKKIESITLTGNDGGNPKSTNIVKKIYRKIFPDTPIIETDSKTAEMTKYMTNTFLSTKVTFANEMKMICDKVGIDYKKVVEYAVYDKRLGNSHWEAPGPDGKFGFGGSCFPKDFNALIYFALENDVDVTLLMSVWEKNLKIRPEKDWEELKGRAVTD